MRKSRARKSPIRKRSVRKSTRRKSHSRVGKSVRRKSAHKSPRKSVRYKYARNYSPLGDEEEEFKKWVEEKFTQKFLYRCISLGELESIKKKGYMSSLSFKPTIRQDVSVAKWIIHHIASQYSSTGRLKNNLIRHPFCGKEVPNKKRKTSDNTKEKPICMISIDLSKLGKYEIIIPSKYQEIRKKNGEKVGKVKRVEHKNENPKVYTEFRNIKNEREGINVFDYYTEIDENGNSVEKKFLTKQTTDTVYLYPAFSKNEGLTSTSTLINRWTSGLTINQYNRMNLAASETVGEVVFCGNIPSEALRVVAQRIQKTMTELPKDVKIEDYTHPDSEDKMATSLDPDPPQPPQHPPDSDDKMAPLDSDDKMDTSLTDSRKRKHNDNDDDNTVLSGIMPPPNRRSRKIVKTSEYVDIYDAEGNKLGTANKDGKYFRKYLNEGVIEIQKLNEVYKYVVVVDRTHDIYDKIAKQNRRLETKSV